MASSAHLDELARRTASGRRRRESQVGAHFLVEELVRGHLYRDAPQADGPKRCAVIDPRSSWSATQPRVACPMAARRLIEIILGGGPSASGVCASSDAAGLPDKSDRRRRRRHRSAPGVSRGRDCASGHESSSNRSATAFAETIVAQLPRRRAPRDRHRTLARVWRVARRTSTPRRSPGTGSGRAEPETAHAAAARFAQVAAEEAYASSRSTRRASSWLALENLPAVIAGRAPRAPATRPDPRGRGPSGLSTYLDCVVGGIAERAGGVPEGRGRAAAGRGPRRGRRSCEASSPR